MRILIDLQPLQTVGAATRGVGRYTNGLLSALASIHDVIGMQRACSYIVPPSADVPMVEIGSGVELEQQLSDWHCDVVINCSGPFWRENVIVSGLRNPLRPIVASIFYDVIPWVFPDVYLQDPHVRSGYHNRCVDLYARADLVCAISQHSKRDALRFGYATGETATTISLGVEPLVPEVQNARQKWKISQPYLLSVSGDEFRKNPELLIAAYLRSDIRKSHSLVIVISNDADTGFSNRMAAKYGNLRAQDVIILPETTESELGALYRDSDTFVFTSLYEGFGIPIVEAMQFGKWIISSKTSSLGEVSGPALLSLIEDPTKLNSIVFAFNEAKQRLDRGRLDGSIPCAQGHKFSWEKVGRNFEDAVERRREARDLKSPTRLSERPQLFWASPFPADESGISFYSEDLLRPVSKQYEVVLVPNTVNTFIPTPKTGSFKIVEPCPEDLLAITKGEHPRIFYNIGNSHFHLNLVDLLFKIPGTVLLHDTFVGGLENLWRERVRSYQRSLCNHIIESSRVTLFLGEHAKSLITSENLAQRPTHVVPLYCRYRGAISATKRNELRQKYRIPEKAFVVTTAGFQNRIKLTDRIVQSCIELKNFEKAPVYVQVLGRFFDTALEAEVRGMLVQNNVPAFLSGGFVDEETLVERVALSDVGVFLRDSSTGGPSAGLNDAMGVGIPCLVTDDFAFREYPEGAILRVVNNEVTEGLILLYRHVRVRQIIATKGLHYAQNMSPEQIAMRICAILALDQCVNQDHPTGSHGKDKVRLIPSSVRSKHYSRQDFFRGLSQTNIYRIASRYLRPFPAVRDRLKKILLSMDTHPKPPIDSLESCPTNECLSSTSPPSEISPMLHNIQICIMKELDRYVAERELASDNPLVVELFRDGLCADSSAYRVNALRQIAEPRLFEALSILLFKTPLDKAPALRLVRKLSRRRLVVLLTCTLLPGRRARVVGLYRQLLRSALSKSPFFFSLAKRVYYWIT